jgi:LysM repeat protein
VEDIETIKQLKIFLIFVREINQAMQKMRSILFVVFVVVGQSVFSQAGLIIQGASPNLHLVHTVVPRENWYSIGRMYNISPKELAPYNKVTLETALSIGQLIRIPLTKTNFAQNNAKETDEVLVPLFHIVQEKEGMYRISINHNKVAAADIKKWNSLSSEQLRPGMKLIVGYLKVKEDQSPLASGGANKIEGASQTVASKEVKAEPKPVETQPKQNTPATQTTPAVTTPPVTAPASVPETENKSAEAGTALPSVNHDGGFFKKQYYSSGKTATGNAGVFKSTSGWNDGKYYALMNNVPVGTIIRVNFSSTNKTIFAKVLGQLPEMKESTGLTVRLSDAAAAELGVAITKFYVDVKY